MITKNDINYLIDLSVKAGKAILDIYNSEDFGVEIKSDNSPLTKADKASNEIIEKGLKKLFPDIPILSEEGKEIPFEERKDWEKFWLVDPLDGTKEFIKRNGEFTVNIALIENNIPAFGVIYVPVTGEIYYGGPNYGSWKDNHQVFVSKKTPQDELSVVQSRSHSGEEESEFYSNYKIKESLSKGSSLKICLVAEGKAEIYFRSGPTWEWDTGAGHAILLGAGGYFVNKDRSELVYNKEVIKNFGFIVSAFEIQ
ncbi:MAG: 3'(2'),5'-bisphosphate nucleotidase CysQ [Chlorobi bacterium]|nr:3'(2'),5'-bisphosphate nucleotidase CysQ [Chlorobiota bacterium]